MIRSALRECYSRIVRTIPFAGGQTALSFNRVTKWLYQGVACPQRAFLRSGHVVMVDPSDYHGRVLHLFGTGDIKVGEVVCSLLDPGDCFLDIGANYGSIGLLASRKVGADGIIHFVEPQPVLHQSVSAAIDRGPRHAHMEVHPLAVSSRSGTLAIHCADNHTGLATLEPDKLTSRSSQSYEVPVMAIDEFLSLHADERPTGIKVDIEGHERVILPSILARPNIRFLVFEACNNPEELFRLFDAADFQIYGLCRAMVLRRARRVDRVEDLSHYHDAVALPRRNLRTLPEHCSFRALAKTIAR